MGFGINHIFFFLEDEAAAYAVLKECQLVANHQQRHAGQGTCSVQAYFDNAILELLWVDNQAEISSRAIARTRLNERSRWTETGACPFGLGLWGRFPFPYWEYKSPAAARGIPVSLASEDARQPFVFRNASFRPDKWGERGNGRQSAVGLKEITKVTLALSVSPAPAIKTMKEMEFIEFIPSVRPGLTLEVSTDSGEKRRLLLPDFKWMD